MGFGSGVSGQFSFDSASLYPPYLSNLTPSFHKGPLGALQPWPGVCPTWASHREGRGLLGLGHSNQKGWAGRKGPVARRSWAAGPLLSEVQWAVCSEGAEPRPVASIPVCATLSNIA